MTYAILADIHGHAPALCAVLEDARACCAAHFLVLGDIANGREWPNEAADLVRGLKNATVVRGNGEDYLREVQDGCLPPYDAAKAQNIRFTYDALSPENRAWLIALPPTAEVVCGGGRIFLAHETHIFFREPEIPYFGWVDKSVAQAVYLPAAKAAALTRPDVLADVLALPVGAHLYGHIHKQFHMAHEGRWFVNPGSVGEPWDGDTAAYTLLTADENGWRVQERRVAVTDGGFL